MATGDRARQATGAAPRGNNGSNGGPPPGTDLVLHRIARTRTMEATFADAMPRGMEATMLIRDAITAIRNVPDLAETDEASFFGALMTAAQLGLRPNVGSLGHGWVLPFWSGKRQRKEAQWVLGYQGMIELAWKTDRVVEIEAHTIYSNEVHHIELGTNKRIEHVPNYTKDRGDPVLHYAMVTMSNGGKIWHVIGEQEIDDFIKQHSETGKRGFGPWVDDRGPMSRKTALRGLWRFMPKTPSMSLALATDEQVRFGTEKDPTVDEAPPAETITVTRTDRPAESTGVHEPVDGERTQQPINPVRVAALDALVKKHGRHVETIIGGIAGPGVPIEHVTVDELRAALDVEAVPE